MNRNPDRPNPKTPISRLSSQTEPKRWSQYWDRLLRHAHCSRPLGRLSKPRTRCRARRTTRRSVSSSTQPRAGPESDDPEPPGPAGGRHCNELTSMAESLCGLLASLPNDECAKFAFGLGGCILLETISENAVRIHRMRPRPTSRTKLTPPAYDAEERRRRVRAQAAQHRCVVTDEGVRRVQVRAELASVCAAEYQEYECALQALRSPEVEVLKVEARKSLGASCVSDDSSALDSRLRCHVVKRHNQPVAATTLGSRSPCPPPYSSPPTMATS